MAKSPTSKGTAPTAAKQAKEPDGTEKKLVIHKQTLDELEMILAEARTMQSRRVCIA